jgi:hypothetical protein
MLAKTNNAAANFCVLIIFDNLAQVEFLKSDPLAHPQETQSTPTYGTGKKKVSLVGTIL